MTARRMYAAHSSAVWAAAAMAGIFVDRKVSQAGLMSVGGDRPINAREATPVRTGPGST